MIPEQIFWWALAVIAVLIAFWVVAVTAVALKELFKPRGKTVVNQVFVHPNPQQDAVVARQIAKAMRS